jgi:hypothetical protein
LPVNFLSKSARTDAKQLGWSTLLGVQTQLTLPVPAQLNVTCVSNRSSGAQSSADYLSVLKLHTGLATAIAMGLPISGLAVQINMATLKIKSSFPSTTSSPVGVPKRMRLSTSTLRPTSHVSRT